MQQGYFESMKNIGLIAGPLIAGYMIDLTQNFSIPFYFASSILILGAIVSYLRVRE